MLILSFVICDNIHLTGIWEASDNCLIFSKFLNCWMCHLESKIITIKEYLYYCHCVNEIPKNTLIWNRWYLVIIVEISIGSWSLWCWLLWLQVISWILADDQLGKICFWRRDNGGWSFETIIALSFGRKSLQ